MSTNQIKTNWAQFIPLVTVFFFWGFVAASNDILIPVFKEAFDLTQGQSQLVSVAFLCSLYSRFYYIHGYFLSNKR